MYLFFDTETTGLPQFYDAPTSMLNNWPRMVQIAWMTFDKDGNQITSEAHIIKPEGYTIPDEAAKIHGITTERAELEGKLLKKILEIFSKAVNESQIIVAHNIKFDEKIVGAEFIRKEVKNSLEEKEKVCTMLSSTNYCQILSEYGNKWPKLTELYLKLFGEKFEDEHDARADVTACARCFFEMKKLQIIN
ncbi:MAG: 3'-5' exonuclease [Nanoarchaeota archaeon]|nr:3'-5' exonuclease [Nanoarchaeota archaeon]MBU1854170.1 3'-5' exonuclease [Nanoarchaeota archaeon]